jgi:exodeoxyribonuclease VII large subunit
MDATTPTPRYPIAAALHAFRKIREWRTHLSDIWIEASVLQLRPDANQTRIWFDLEDDSGRISAKTLAMDLRPLLDESERTGVRLRLRGSIRMGVCHEDKAGIEVREAERACERSGHGQLLAWVRAGHLRRAQPTQLPTDPDGIAIISPPGSRALDDVLAVLDDEGSDAVRHMVSVPMRGHKAAARIVDALDEASERVPLSVTLVVRGGGDADDFRPFDDLGVAGAILAHPVPVITGIGHAKDRTLADAVADLSCPAPALAAYKACYGTDVVPRIRRGLAGTSARTGEHDAELLQQLIHAHYPAERERGA